MSLKYLGETLDIHGGGFDLVFPHHENEIAQTEAYTGVIPSVRYWIHNGLLQLGEEKMSKSLGNLVTVKEALASYSPDALRLFFLSSHYRSPLTYSDEAIQSMERGAARLRNAVESPSQSADTGAEVSPDLQRKQFVEAMEDDFNTPQAIAALHDLAREINRGKHNGAGTLRAVETLKELAGVLGLTLKEPLAKAPLDSSALRELVQSIARDLQSSGLDALAESLDGIHVADEAGPDAYIEALISVRGELRKAREWGLADRIRDGLAELGIALEDTPQGSLWKRS
ncbi:MAG: class I tRNA ligase family protein, partial [Chloroflexi bacterium]|nr:class I tRNA ligase family protein [Chloroflexota bacterium]